MLTTPKETLKAVTEKEEMEFKMQQVQNMRKGQYNHIVIQRDHLPYAKLQLKIALDMPDAPKVPLFKAQFRFEDFKNLFREYYEQYRDFYIKQVQMQRTRHVQHGIAKEIASKKKAT